VCEKKEKKGDERREEREKNPTIMLISD